MPALNHDAKGHEMLNITSIDVGSKGINDYNSLASKICFQHQIPLGNILV
jgi:hypothetical protein